jgi:AP-1 complex subunit beta-1
MSSAAPQSGGAGGAYFSSSKRGEVAELRDELNNKDKDAKKEAVKRVIAAMTVGKDVSALFSDVLKCMVTNDLELKKLVYLYLMNYAKTQPDLAILAVNSFVKDTRDSNPLIRALAIRTMSSIRVEEVTNYLCEPLRKAVKDEDPYVRKTAAICIAKLHDIDDELVADQGLMEDLKDLLADSNPMVVANAVAALSEIAAVKPSAFEIGEREMSKLLAAMNECTEWGQIYILDAVSQYTPQDESEAKGIIERVVPRLSHANSGVVLSACKVIMRCLDFVRDDDYLVIVAKKMSPALVTLLGSEPEIQYVALRNIIVLLQKLPGLLSNDIRVFYCKYNDPIYVKMEKLEVMIMLANARNIDQVIQEFKDSASEVDVDFVRKAVRSIGRCAIKLEEAADRCVQALLDLIQTKVSYVVQEVIVVIKDIFRKYPDRYESVIGQLCENLDSLDEADAKASLFWIIGEYADRIDGAHDILDTFFDTFTDEPAEVQLQFLTAVVKCFIVSPDDAQDLMRRVLGLATQSDNPDLRDRGYLYWRLLSADPATARDVVLAEKPIISGETSALDQGLLRVLLTNIGTLSSVFHRPPETFVSKLKAVVPKTISTIPTNDDENLDDVVQRVAKRDDEGVVEKTDDLLGDLGLGGGVPSSGSGGPPSVGGGSGLDDLLGGSFGAGPSSAGAGGDLMSGAPAAAAAGAPSQRAVPWLAPADGNGMGVSGYLTQQGADTVAVMTFENRGSAPISGIFIQLNANALGLAPAATRVPIDSVAPGGRQSANVTLARGVANKLNREQRVAAVDVAIKNNSGVYYMQTYAPGRVVLRADGQVDRRAFQEAWAGVSDADEGALDERAAVGAGRGAGHLRGRAPVLRGQPERDDDVLWRQVGRRHRGHGGGRRQRPLGRSQRALGEQQLRRRRGGRVDAHAVVVVGGGGDCVCARSHARTRGRVHACAAAVGSNNVWPALVSASLSCAHVRARPRTRLCRRCCAFARVCVCVCVCGGWRVGWRCFEAVRWGGGVGGGVVMRARMSSGVVCALRSRRKARRLRSAQCERAFAAP